MPESTGKKRRRDSGSSDQLHEAPKSQAKKQKVEFIERASTSQRRKTSKAQNSLRGLKSCPGGGGPNEHANGKVVSGEIHDDPNNNDASITAVAPISKPKKAISKPKSSKSKTKTCRQQGKVTNKSEAQPPTSSIAPLSTAVLSQINLIHEYLRNKPTTVLDRHSRGNRSTNTIPETALLGALITMRIRYEMGSADQASISDVQAAVVDRCTRTIGENPNVDFIVIDTSIETKFIDEIKHKIRGHGLDDADVLGIQLEMNRLDQLKHMRLMDSWRTQKWDLAVWDSEKNIENSNGIAEAVKSENLDYVATSPCAVFGSKFDHLGKQEHGRYGVCPAPLAQGL